MVFKAPTKKVSDVQDYVKRMFGDESGVQITDTDIIRWVNSAQQEIVSSNQVLKASATKDTVADTFTYQLGADITDVQAINSIHVDGLKLSYLSFNDAEALILREDPSRTVRGRPEYWYEWAGILHLYPTPDKIYTLTVYYQKEPPLVTTGTDTLSLPDNYFNRIIEYVMTQAYELDENFGAAETKSSQFESRLVSMSLDEEKANIDTYPRITVRPEDL
ncbi:MAG TPA: DUF6682 family protein [Chitinophagaceae bacterium]